MRLSIFDPDVLTDVLRRLSGFEPERRRDRPRRRPPPGAAPGTLVADPDLPTARIKAIAYGPDEIIEHADISPEDATKLLGSQPVVWIDVEGLGDVSIVEKISAGFGIHPLVQEDILYTHQRPKSEQYDSHLFVVTRMPDPDDAHFDTEQVSMLVGKDHVITFQERPGDVFDPVRHRIRRGQTRRIREEGADYLAYALLDAVTDAYYPVLERYGEAVDVLETAVLEDAEADLITDIHGLKRGLLDIRRSIWPQRELYNALIRDESPFICEQTRVYLRDCYDHAIQLLDITENYRDVAASLIDTHLTSVNNRMNEVMKVLTIIATIFIPLSFVTGVYGMNFNTEASPWNMPELGWRYGYFFVLGVMLAMVTGLLLYFGHRGWLGRGGSRRRRRRRKAQRKV